MMGINKMKKRIEITLFAVLMLGQVTLAFAQQSAPIAQNRIGSLFSSAREDALLEPDQAFRLKVAVKGPNTVLAELIPANGYYLYKERIHFSLKDANGVTINTVKLPSGEIKTDQIFGKTEVYKKTIPAEITVGRSAKANKLTLVASYQGCHEKLGVCYPPIEKTVNLTLP
jgi:thiol:disulfide interchange protein DsbD